MAQITTIDETTAAEHASLFGLWVENVAYEQGAIRLFNGNIYRCVQAHTSQGDWTPEAATSLWTKISDPADKYPKWSRPIGSHDVYNTGDKVSYDGKHWESTVDVNVWQPGVYGWDEVI